MAISPEFPDKPKEIATPVCGLVRNDTGMTMVRKQNDKSEFDCKSDTERLFADYYRAGHELSAGTAGR